MLDEPVDGLDPVMRRQIWSILMSEVSEKKMSVLISSHNLRELEDVCDHIGIMNKGKILLQHSLEDLQSSVTKIQVVFEDEMPDLDREFHIVSRSDLGKVHTLIIRGDSGEITDALNKYHLIFMEVLPLSLEEIFIYELEGEHYEVKDIIWLCPLWVIEFILLQLLSNISLSFSLANTFHDKMLPSHEKVAEAQDAMAGLLIGEDNVLITAVVSITTAVLVFGYLYRKVSAYATHSLPLSRTVLFCSHFAAGFLIITVPLCVFNFG